MYLLPGPTMAPLISPDDQLYELELNIARRADELARVRPSGGSAKRDRETWTRAENEVLSSAMTASRRRARWSARG